MQIVKRTKRRSRVSLSLFNESTVEHERKLMGWATKSSLKAAQQTMYFKPADGCYSRKQDTLRGSLIYLVGSYSGVGARRNIHFTITNRCVVAIACPFRLAWGTLFALIAATQFWARQVQCTFCEILYYWVKLIKHWMFNYHRNSQICLR